MNAAVSRFVDAARRGDPAEVSASIDWSASGVGTFVRALWLADPGDRSTLAARGLPNLLTEGTAVPIPLGSLASLLAGQLVIRPPRADETDAVRATLQPPDLPPEVAGPLADEIRAVARRVAHLPEIWILEPEEGNPAAIAAGAQILGVAVVRAVHSP